MDINNKKSFYMHVGSRLKGVREDLCLTQKFVSEKIGCNRTDVTSWELVRYHIPLRRFVQLTRLYNIKWGYDMRAVIAPNDSEITADVLAGIGGRIKAVRERREISYRKMGKMMGVPTSTISRWQREIYFPSIFQVYVMTQLLGVYMIEIIPGLGKDKLVACPDTLIQYFESIQGTISQSQLQDHLGLDGLKEAKASGWIEIVGGSGNVLLLLGPQMEIFD